METKTNSLLVTAGPLSGRRFEVSEPGIRLGRSSSCEIAVEDPALSRNQCLFEFRDGSIWVTDLASANGTTVNDEELGETSRELKAGDRVQAGDTELVVEATGGAESAEGGEGEAVEGSQTGDVDLGLSASGDEEEVPAKPKSSPLRIVLWLLLVVALAGAAAAILLVPRDAGGGVSIMKPLAKARLWSVSYEKVEATPEGICRYALEVDAEGRMTAVLDDVPESNRHMKKSVELSEKARAELDRLFSSSSFYKLDQSYSGTARPGELNRYEFRISRGSSTFTCCVENAPEPPAFREMRLAVETFSQNELGVWAIRYDAGKLVEMSLAARAAADAKWEERDVNYGNIAEALKLYDEAVTDLDTVNPKPEDYGELVTKRDMVRAELDRRYKDQRFEADRAVNTGDWERAKKELAILCELVPDRKDPRHAEAAAKLIDVENRLKKGASR